MTLFQIVGTTLILDRNRYPTPYSGSYHHRIIIASIIATNVHGKTINV